MIVREIVEDDAEAFLMMQCQLDGETDFMLMAPGERKTTAVRQKQIIQNLISDERSMIWLLDDGQQIAGALSLKAMGPMKIRHTGLIVVGIRLAYRGQGWGSALFDRMLGWAPNHGFHRLELTVMTENRAALSLYLKFGFLVEGLRRDSIRQPNGRWVDEYMMAKLI